MKIVTAANMMISRQELITNVLPGRNEYFFLYDGKYKWSISHLEEGDIYFLHYYPGNADLEALAAEQNWNEIDYMTYSSKTLGTKEAQQTFQDLYQIVKEKIYGIDTVLNDIISGS